MKSKSSSSALSVFSDFNMFYMQTSQSGKSAFLAYPEIIFFIFDQLFFSLVREFYIELLFLL